MYRYLHYFLQPGVVSTGLMGTALQVGISFANSLNIAGAADLISQYGLNGQLASGGMIAALTGAYYTFTQRKVTQTVAAGAGAVAGGISGTLGTAITQAFGWSEVAAGTTPLIDFAALATAFMSLVGMADPAAPAAAAPMLDTVALTQVFGSTAIGGGIGAMLGKMLVGERKTRRRSSHA